MPERDLTTLLCTMRPTLNHGVYVYACLELDQMVPPQAIGSFREPEGITVILEKT